MFVALLSDAAESARRRAYKNIHHNYSDAVQRTIVALKNGTYVRPHLHPQGHKWKLLVVLQGTLGVLIFNEDGTVEERVELSPGGDCSGVELSAQTWHTVFPLNGDAAILDIKEGPYDPAAPVLFASWSPAEGDPVVPEFLEWAEDATIGERWPPGD